MKTLREIHIGRLQRPTRSAASAVFLGLLLSAPVNATDVGFSLRYNPAHLGDPDLAAELYQRIEHAARNACEDPGKRPLAQRMVERECTAELTQRAIEKIDSPTLSRIHLRKQRKFSG